ncbi:hypothetical protein RRG08_038129 [Elysia crispata]|uniref:Uncharacterized protein n=1 Tax=Elysia crispata TaxID=231223 RepID=A0AAE1DQC8_9GAST|nr:hypothetical protein RRG08_038129 [Elysia crispata]
MTSSTDSPPSDRGMHSCRLVGKSPPLADTSLPMNANLFIYSSAWAGPSHFSELPCHKLMNGTHSFVLPVACTALITLSGRTRG